MEEYLKYYFRCNSTLESEDTLYNVDCRYDEDLSYDTTITRNEDATMPCYKVLGKETGIFGGVSKTANRDRCQIKSSKET